MPANPQRTEKTPENGLIPTPSYTPLPEPLMPQDNPMPPRSSGIPPAKSVPDVPLATDTARVSPLVKTVLRHLSEWLAPT